MNKQTRILGRISMYSGLPNPERELTDEEIAHVQEMIGHIGPALKEHVHLSGLGFTGFIVAPKMKVNAEFFMGNVYSLYSHMRGIIELNIYAPQSIGRYKTFQYRDTVGMFDYLSNILGGLMPIKPQTIVSIS